MRSAWGNSSCNIARLRSGPARDLGVPRRAFASLCRESEHNVGYETILYAEDGPVGTLTLNRPDDGNMFTETMCHEMRDCINAVRRETRTRVLVITGAGDKFFCIGGRKTGMAETMLYAGVLPTLDMYESIERLQKPVIAAVNGYAVGGGNVLQVMCDITIARESAIFRQVGPMMGSFDAGFGTWYLEDLVGKKKAKEIWFRNPRMTAREALELGMINQVVPDVELAAATRAMALEIAERGAFALAAIKAAFGARHGGVAGLSRVTHDLLLRPIWRATNSANSARPSLNAATPTPINSGIEAAPRCKLPVPNRPNAWHSSLLQLHSLLGSAADLVDRRGSWICVSGWMGKGVEVRLGPGDPEPLVGVIGWVTGLAGEPIGAAAGAAECLRRCGRCRRDERCERKGAEWQRRERDATDRRRADERSVIRRF